MNADRSRRRSKPLPWTQEEGLWCRKDRFAAALAVAVAVPACICGPPRCAGITPADVACASEAAPGVSKGKHPFPRSRMLASRPMLLAVALLASALPLPLAAQGRLIPRPCQRGDCPPPVRPCIAGGCPLPRVAIERSASDVRVELRDRVLRYQVDERFVNYGGVVGEADYVFPLPKNAAFEGLKLEINGELVAGEIMDAEHARQTYEAIVRQQRDPALVEWMGHGLLRARIFPIAPGEEKRVVVRFQAVAEREG